MLTIEQVRSIADIKRFLSEIRKEGTAIDPDMDFASIPHYTKAQADHRNRLMSQCHGVAIVNDTTIEEFL